MDLLIFLMALLALILSAVRVTGGASSEQIRKLELRLELMERRERAARASAAPASVNSRAAVEADWFRTAAATRSPAPADQIRPAAPRSTPEPSEMRIAQPASTIPARAAPRMAAPSAPPEPSLLVEMAKSSIAVMRTNPFASAGVLMFLIGLGFLFSLLAARNILPPELRIGLIALSGVGVFAVGVRLEHKRGALGLNLEGGALAIEFLCTLWAFDGYHLITSSQAFIALGLLSALSFGYAMARRGVAFAFMGLAGALLTPIVTSTGHGEFSALVLYCAFITLLSVTTGVRLRSLLLSASAFVGTTLLLYLAIDRVPGSQGTIVSGLVFITLVQLAGTLRHYFEDQRCTGNRSAALVSMLLFPTLAYTALIFRATAIPDASAALLPAASALVLVFTAWNSTAASRNSLIAISSILGFVAIGLHYQSASHAVVLAAGALGLAILSRMIKSRLVSAIAMFYWVVSIGIGLSALVGGNSVPLLVAAAVGLGASYTSRSSRTGVIYTLVTPVVAGIAALERFGPSAEHATEFLLVWTVAATALARMLRWSQLRAGAFWLLPTGLLLLFSGDLPIATMLIFQRELLLLGWLGASTALVATTSPSQLLVMLHAKIVASLFIPVVISIELSRMLSGDGSHSVTVLPSMLALIWSVAALFSRVLHASAKRDLVSQFASVWAVLFALTSIFLTALNLGHALLLGIALAALLLHLKRGVIKFRLLRVSSVWWLLAGASFGIVFQLIGLINHVDEAVALLLFQAVMQPFVSLLWAVSGIVVVAIGSRQGLRQFWIGGAFALALLMLKMLVVDLASLTLIAKVGTFMAVGAGLILLGYSCPLPPKQAGLMPAGAPA